MKLRVFSTLAAGRDRGVKGITTEMAAYRDVPDIDVRYIALTAAHTAL
jgi:hypothetical protein